MDVKRIVGITLTSIFGFTAMIFLFIAICYESEFVWGMIAFGGTALITLIIAILFFTNITFIRRGKNVKTIRGTVVSKNFYKEWKYINYKRVEINHYTIYVNIGEEKVVPVESNMGMFNSLESGQDVTLVKTFANSSYRIDSLEYRKKYRRSFNKGISKSALIIILGIVGGLVVGLGLFFLMELII